MKPTLTIGTQYATMTDRESVSGGCDARRVSGVGEVTRRDASTAPPICLAPRKGGRQKGDPSRRAGNGPPFLTHSRFIGDELDNSWGFCVGFDKPGLERNVAFVRGGPNCFRSEEDPRKMRKGSCGLPAEFARSRGFRGARRPQGIRSTRSFDSARPVHPSLCPKSVRLNQFGVSPSGVSAVWTDRLSTQLA